MITNFFIPELNNHDVQELWFQQDGSTRHTARATIYLLKDTFGDRLISRLGPVNWPPRSCDLTPLDYFLSAQLPLQTKNGPLQNGFCENRLPSCVAGACDINNYFHFYTIRRTVLKFDKLITFLK
ncbi:hypothetical protein TNCV_4917641 [Trichonephila clavipes]|nr:hypothetical protein TNCV_4917641 [Trichonephila clavipes]